MGHTVYADGKEIAAKAGSSKTIANVPDICLTPPPPILGPLPVLYANTAFASDLSEGSRDVLIAWQGIYKRDKSYACTSTGDEAGTFKGVMSGSNVGKMYFTGWSSTVFVEGENVCRADDTTTNNHASSASGNTPPVAHNGGSSGGGPADPSASACKAGEEQAEKACEKARLVTHDEGKALDCSQAPGCKEAKQGLTTPFKDAKTFCCLPDNTGHHLVEVHCFLYSGGRKKAKTEPERNLPDFPSYDDKLAPCVCASEKASRGTHAIMHAVQNQIEAAYRVSRPLQKIWVRKSGPPDCSHWTYEDARNAGLTAHSYAFRGNASASGCIKAQLDAYHNDQAKIPPHAPVRTDMRRQRKKRQMDRELDRIPGATADLDKHIRSTLKLVRPAY